MSTDVEDLSKAMLRLTRADAGFEQLCDQLLTRVRTMLGAPLPDATGASSDPLVDEEFARLRERLTGYLPEYERIYRSAIVRHLGADNLAPCVAALESPALRRYFEAVHAMQPELAREVQRLTREMGNVALFEE